MSSFDYTDNFSGFNDLINRAEILEEKNWKQLVKGADLTGKLKSYRTDEGDPIGASSRVKNLITIGALERMKIIDEELAKALKRKATSSTHITDLLKGVPELYDELFEGDNPRSLKVVQYIDDNTEELIPYAVKNFTRSEYGAKTEEELKRIDFIDVADDAKEELQSTADAFETYAAAKEDPTTMVEIRIEDPSKAEVVKDMVKKYANEHLDVEGNSITFSADPGTPLADAVSRHGVDKIEAALKRDVDAISNSVVVVMKPDEGEEDDMYGMEGNESYAANENEVQEDNEGLSAKKARAGKDIGKPGKNFKKISDKAAKKYGSKEAGDRVAGAVLAKMRGNYEGEEHPAQRAAESIIGAEVMWDGFRKRGQVEEVDVERGIAIVYDEDGGEHMVELGDFDVVNEVEDNENELDHFLTKEQPEDYIPSTDYEDVLDDLVNKDKKEHALKKLNGDDDDPGHIDDMRAEYPPDPFGGGYEDEEEFSYSPMLDSYKTSTANYLTEQAA